MTEEKNEVIFDDDKISKSEEFVNPDELYQELIQCVQKYHPSDDISMIEKAYKVASEAHKNQFRKSGEPYIIHPLNVAIILADLNLLNTYTGLIISSAVSIFGIFLLRQAFMQVPAGLIEAAKMDGAGHWKTLWKIIMPMTKSSFITFGLMSFITCYNNYMWPSLITDDTNLSLVSQGLRQFFIEGGAYGTNWSLVMAGSAVIVLPLLILFAFTQKWFINGIGGDTGMKG